MEIKDILSCESDVVSGSVVFKGSRVPVDTLFANLSIEEFLENFPTIERKQVEDVLLLALQELKAHFPRNLWGKHDEK